MRRNILGRVIVLLLVGLLGFWLGTYHHCSYQTPYVLRKATERQGGQVSNHTVAQTAKFNRVARKYALEMNCCKKKYPLKNLLSRSAVHLLRHVIVDRKNKFLYCFIPKVASSNMKRLVLTLQGRSENSNAIQYFDQRGFEFLSDVSGPEQQQMVDTFYKFLFVRDPLSRLVSAYRNKFVQANNQFHIAYGRKIVQRYRSNVSTSSVKGDDVTFREFINYVIAEDVTKMNEHWMPMYDICQPCYMAYHFVGSFENLDLDTKALLQELNSSERVSFPKKQDHYQQPLSRDDIKLFYTNITADEYSALHKKFLNDFKCFSYPFPHKIHHLPSS